jgi:hypothetical protein
MTRLRIDPNQGGGLTPQKEDVRVAAERESLDRKAGAIAVGITAVLFLIFGFLLGSNSRDSEVAELNHDVAVMRRLEELDHKAICEGMRFLARIGVLDDETYATLRLVSEPVPDGLSPLYCSDLVSGKERES